MLYVTLQCCGPNVRDLFVLRETAAVHVSKATSTLFTVDTDFVEVESQAALLEPVQVPAG